MKKSKSTDSATTAVLAAAAKMRDRVDELDFSQSIPWVYNPLKYAWAAHQQYVQHYARSSARVLLLGMNPGPWGMAQTGVPFGEVNTVVDWLKIDATIGKPPVEHPKRPITGLSCQRSEVSGKRLWGLCRERFITPEAFFEGHYVANYCPLVFMEESARNVTPDKLPANLREPLETICDEHLFELIEALRPDWVIGVGGFAEDCVKRVLIARPTTEYSVQTGRILHPSPASPAANRDWVGTATKQLISLGVWSK